ncbi:MAG: hypothetical protein ACI9KE_005107, partial [Polyangiales bacterium]
EAPVPRHIDILALVLVNILLLAHRCLALSGFDSPATLTGWRTILAPASSLGEPASPDALVEEHIRRRHVPTLVHPVDGQGSHVDGPQPKSGPALEFANPDSPIIRRSLPSLFMAFVRA